MLRVLRVNGGMAPPDERAHQAVAGADVRRLRARSLRAPLAIDSAAAALAALTAIAISPPSPYCRRGRHQWRVSTGAAAAAAASASVTTVDEIVRRREADRAWLAHLGPSPGRRGGGVRLK